jgi:hypothetical protein
MFQNSFAFQIEALMIGVIKLFIQNNRLLGIKLFTSLPDNSLLNINLENISLKVVSIV